MDREAAINVIAEVLVAHDMAKGYAVTCICGNPLYNDGEPTLTRHRAEKIADGLGL